MGQCSQKYGGGKWRVNTNEVDQVYKDQGIGSVSWNSAGMAEEELRDPENLDFRPVKNGVVSKLCIGAYDSVGKGGLYWLPGHQELVATMPIPPSGSTTVKWDANLMFKPARGAVKHFVYGALTEAALDPSKVKKPSNKLRQGALNAPNNIIQPKKWLMNPKKAPREIFWRVDAKFKDGSIKPGSVWKFSVDPKSNTQVTAPDCVSFHASGPNGLADGQWTDLDLKVPQNGGRPMWERIKSAEVCIKASHSKDMGSLQFKFGGYGKFKVLAKKGRARFQERRWMFCGYR